MSKVEVLERFLEEEGIYIEFINNLIRYYNIERFNILIFEQIFEHFDIRDFFTFAFIWDETPEGYEFWQEKAEKWIEFLDKRVYKDEEYYIQGILF